MRPIFQAQQDLKQLRPALLAAGHQLAISHLQFLKKATDRNTVRVDCQTSIDQLIHDGKARHKWTDLKDCVPSFDSMWLEAKFGEDYAACLVLKERNETGWMVSLVPAHSRERVLGLGEFVLTLDGNGDVIDANGGCLPGMPDNLAFRTKQIGFCFAWSLGLMNAGNARLIPLDNAKWRANWKPNDIPLSVFRKIDIRRMDRVLRRAGRSALDCEARKIEREVWVRGHWADYRDGPGMFCNPQNRKRYYITDYRRGDPSLGTTIPNYII